MLGFIIITGSDVSVSKEAVHCSTSQVEFCGTPLWTGRKGRQAIEYCMEKENKQAKRNIQCLENFPLSDDC